MPPVETFDLACKDDEALLALSARLGLALDVREMRAVAKHFAAVGRPPTDVELQSLALAWSEHCSHKTFKATIDFGNDGQSETIEGLLQSCFVQPTRQLNRSFVLSAFDDNAGIIAFDDEHDLAIKVETHNHPSALEPYGGAHTGVGGVIRDVLAVSAEPIANTDVLCFGMLDTPDESLPDGAFHPRVTFREVVRGVADYGNNMGIPTVGGAVVFHPAYTANPLVYCGTIGMLPTGGHPRHPQPGDLIVVLGGRTGRDGLNGATMSSATLDRETVAGSTVQIGAPITEKCLRDVLPKLRDQRLYHAITDCGAGGLCSAVGEMGEELGVEVDLSTVPLKYAGLRPWEIWLSEAQERMVLAVPAEAWSRIEELCAAHDVEATMIGRFADNSQLRLRYRDNLVADLPMDFLHEGRPKRTLPARWRSGRPQNVSGDRREASSPAETETGSDRSSHWANGALLNLLAHPNIASKEPVIRRYDHEVQGATMVKPLTGHAGPSDAAVLQPLPDSNRGVVIAHGINPLYGEADPYHMALLAVDEALRNLVAVGGNLQRAALLDNFCWGEVDNPDDLGRLVRAAQGCRDAAFAYGVPFISGKDSLRNTSIDSDGTHSIPGTLLITAIGVMDDVRRSVTMDLKRAESSLFILGETREGLARSHYGWTQLGRDRAETQKLQDTLPQADAAASRVAMLALNEAIREGLVLSCHDLSEGGLAVAAAEMVIAGELGLDLDLSAVPANTNDRADLLFGETSGRFLVEVPGEQEEGFLHRLQDAPVARLGRVTDEPRLRLRHEDDVVVDLDLKALGFAWRHPLQESAA